MSCAAAIAEEGVNVIEDFSCIAEAIRDGVDEVSVLNCDNGDFAKVPCSLRNVVVASRLEGDFWIDTLHSVGDWHMNVDVHLSMG